MVCLNLTDPGDHKNGNNGSGGGGGGSGDSSSPPLGLEERKAQAMFEEVSHVIYGFLLPSVCAFGMVGNVLNLTILTRRKLQKSFRTLEQAANLCLISLAVSDLMFCVFAFPSMFLPKDDLYASRGVLLTYRVYCTAVINVFIMISTWLTVAMSLERYLAICHPLRQDLYLTTRRIKIVIVLTYILSFIFNVPVLWRYEVQEICVPPRASSPVSLLHEVVEELAGRTSTAGPSSGGSLQSGGGGGGGVGVGGMLDNVTNLVGGGSGGSGGGGESLVNFTLGNFSDVLTMMTTATTTSSSSGPLTDFSDVDDEVENVTAAIAATVVTNVVVTASMPTTTTTTMTTTVATTATTTTATSRETSSEGVVERILITLSTPVWKPDSNSRAVVESVLTTQPTITTPLPARVPPAKSPGSVAFRPNQVFLWGSSQVDTVYRILWAVVNNVVPLVLLVYFNVCLCRKIYRSYKMRQKFKQEHHSRHAKDSSHVLTVTLVVIVLMFFLLVAPSEVVIHAALLTNTNNSYTYMSVEAVMNFMQSLNFSVNFILYCIISPYFRKTLRYLFCCGCYNIYQVSKQWKKDFETSLM